MRWVLRKSRDVSYAMQGEAEQAFLNGRAAMGWCVRDCLWLSLKQHDNACGIPFRSSRASQLAVCLGNLPSLQLEACDLVLNRHFCLAANLQSFHVHGAITSACMRHWREPKKPQRTLSDQPTNVGELRKCFMSESLSSGCRDSGKGIVDLCPVSQFSAATSGQKKGIAKTSRSLFDRSQSFSLVSLNRSDCEGGSEDNLTVLVVQFGGTS